MRDLPSTYDAFCPNFTENGTKIKQTYNWSARAKKIFLCKRNGKHSFTKIFWFSEFPYFRIWLFFIVFHRISLKYGFLQKIHCGRAPVRALSYVNSIKYRISFANSIRKLNFAFQSESRIICIVRITNKLQIGDILQFQHFENWARQKVSVQPLCGKLHSN